MTNSFKIIEMLSPVGRNDALFVLETTAGHINRVCGELTSPELPGSWKVTALLLMPPASDPTLARRVAVALTGPDGLEPGMHLVESVE
jgi:hypothetical protein